MGQRYSANKNLGQHFLQDMDIITKIVRYVDISASEHLLEIGPGPGAITQHIAQKYRFFDAIELDTRFYELLSKKYQAIQNINIHNANILDFNLADIFRDIKFNIVGNLPYNIGSQIIFHLVTYKKLIDKMLFMLQTEVVNNIVSKVGSKNYGRLSILAQSYYDIKKVLNVSPNAFSPAPKVNSAILHFKYHNKIENGISAKQLEKLTGILFSKRRKKVSTILKGYNLKNLDVDLNLRPEQLTLKEFHYLANLIE